jgi:hypothetical protein
VVDSTIITAVPPAQTKTLLLQTFYHIMQTQIHSVSPSVQMHSIPEAVGHHGNAESRSWHMHNSWHVSVCMCVYVMPTTYVHSVQQKSSGLKYCTSCSVSDVTYNCHHNLSCFTFPIFVHMLRFCLPFITNNRTMYILTTDTNTFA